MSPCTESFANLALVIASLATIWVDTVPVSPVVISVPVISGTVIVLSAVGSVIAKVVSLPSSVAPSKTKLPVIVCEPSLFTKSLVNSCWANNIWSLLLSKSVSVKTLPSAKSTFFALISVSLVSTILAVPLGGVLPEVNCTSEPTIL